MRSLFFAFLAVPFVVACGGSPSNVGSSAAQGLSDPDSGSSLGAPGAACTAWDQCASQKCWVTSGETTGICQGDIGTSCTQSVQCTSLACDADGTCVASCTTSSTDESVPCCYGFSCTATDGGTDAAVAPAPACYASPPFGSRGPTWKKPTRLHQGVCTTAEIGAFEACIGVAGCTSGHASCDSCLQTKETAREYGPVITGTPQGDIINWGGCQAHVDRALSKGSCGNQTNTWQACASLACGTCGSTIDDCAGYAATTGCASAIESTSCQDEWAAGEVATECGDFATLATSWCGY